MTFGDNVSAFKDNTGREWILRIDPIVLGDLRKELDVDLGKLDQGTMQRLADDICLLVDVLWVICREQAEAASITDRQFGRSIYGDSIDSATTALLDAIADFSPARQRSLLRCLAEKQEALKDKAFRMAMAKIEDPALMEGLEQKLMDSLDQVVPTGSSYAGNWPES